MFFWGWLLLKRKSTYNIFCTHSLFAFIKRLNIHVQRYAFLPGQIRGGIRLEVGAIQIASVAKGKGVIMATFWSIMVGLTLILIYCLLLLLINASL